LYKFSGGGFLRCENKVINGIINDFYHCCGIPTKVYNASFSEIHSVGYDSKLDKYIDNIKVKNDIQNINFLKLKDTYHVLLNYSKNVHFIVMVICENYSMGYFLLGPFSSDSCNELNITYKPISCIEYLTTFISKICKDRLGYKPMYSFYVKKSIEHIHKNYRDDLTITDMCDYIGLNKSYFCSLFKKETGYTFTNFVNKVRIEKSKEYLLKNDMSILDIAVSVGFNSQNYYSMAFKKYNNLTPHEYRNIQERNN